jgi:hypothetical protein
MRIFSDFNLEYMVIFLVRKQSGLILEDFVNLV